MVKKMDADEFLESGGSTDSGQMQMEKQDADAFLESGQAMQDTTQKSKPSTPTIQTPDFLKSKNIPTGEDFWKAAKATPEVADAILTGTAAYGAGFSEQMRVTSGKLLSNLNPLTDSVSVKEAVEAGRKRKAETGKFIKKALHFGAEPEYSPTAERSLEVLSQVEELPREWVFEPVGKSYGKLVGSKAAGKLTTDALEFTAEIALMPFLAKYGKTKMARYKSRAKTSKRTKVERGEALKGEEAKASRRKQAEEAFKDHPAAREEARMIEREMLEDIKKQEKAETARQEEFFDPADPEVRREISEKGKRADDAEAIRIREHEARQQMYEDFFSDENVSEFIDDVENFADRKARGEGPSISKEEVELLYDNWVERVKDRDPVLRKDWQNWQAEKLRLDAEGIKPEADLFRGLQLEIGPEGRGLPPGQSDLKFGIETGRPYPQESQMEPLIKTVSGYTPQKEKLGYKGDYTLRRKMRPTGKNKAPSREEYKAAQETVVPKAERQGTALMQMGETILSDLEARGIDTRRSEFGPGVESTTDVTPSSSGGRRQVVKEAFNEALGETRSFANIYDVRRRAREKGLADEDVDAGITEAREQGEIALGGGDPSSLSREAFQDTGPWTRAGATGSGYFSMQKGRNWEPGPDSLAEAKAETSGFKDYTPPADEQAVEMSQAQMAARERMLRETVARKRETAKSAELNKLMEEQKADIEGTSPEQETLSLDDIRHLDDTNEYLSENWEPTEETPFRESLQMESNRPLDEMIEDWKVAMRNDWSDERGSISFEKLNKAQRDAINRLNKDLQVIKRNANRMGKSISKYLLDAGFTSDVNIAQYIEENAESVVRDEHTKTDIDSGGADPAKVTRMYERMRQANKKSKTTFKEKLQNLGTKVWAVDTKVRRALEEDESLEASAALNAKINAKGAQAWADQYFRDVQDKVFGHLSGAEREAVDTFVNARNKLEIARRHGGLNRATPEGVTAKEYAAFLDNFQRENRLSNESYARVKQATEDYFNVMNDLLTMKYKEGALPEWLYSMLKENRYAPIRYMETAESGNILQSKSGSLDTSRTPRDLEELQTMVKDQVGSNEFNTKSSEIRKLAGGKDKWENLNSEELLAAMVSETTNWVMKNRTTKSLGKYAENVPNENVRPGDVKKEWVDEHGAPRKSYHPAPEGMSELHYFENGERKVLYAQDWFANQWANSSPEMTQGFAGTMRALSLSGLTRTFATGAGNPLFFMKGHPMDVLTIYMNAQKRGADGKYKGVYSPHPPKFLPQLYSDMIRVAPDIIGKKGRYTEGIEDGLVMNWLTEGGQPTFSRIKANRGPVGAAKKGLEGVRDILSYPNRLSEVLARYAVRERMLREGYDRSAATAAARDYMDYSQGGSYVKGIDNAVPYFNVAAQAARTTLRSAKRNPKEFALKSGYLMSFASAMYMMAYNRDKKALDQSSDYIKNNYFLAPTGWKLKDDFGNEHRVSFKIRKEPSLAPLFTAAELGSAALMGDKVEYNRIWKSFATAMPRVGTSSVPSGAAAAAYFLNKNAYFGSDIWKGGNVNPEAEIEEDTHQFFRDVGTSAGLSPARLQGVAQQIVGDGGMFGDLAGSGYDWIRDSLGEEEHELTTADMILEGWGNEALHVTSEPNEYWDMLDQIDKDENSIQAARSRRLDKLAKQYYVEESIDFEKINEFIGQFNRDTQNRLENRLENFAWTQDLPRRNMWMGISSMNKPEAKAKAVVKWMSKEDQESRKEIQRGLIYLKHSPSSIIPESTDSKFWKELHKEMSNMGGEE